MTAKKNIVETPLMKQYNAIKAKYPDALLLFRVGDFYETFSEDAIKASQILGIVLTKRANGAASYVELAGFPHHSIDTYLPKLVRAGQRVAICDQLEDPKLTKKIVKRGVTELVTPGVTFNDNVLNNKENNFLACVHFQPTQSGVAFLDVSTGEFLVAEGNNTYIDKLLQSFKPSEVIVQRNKENAFKNEFGSQFLTFNFEEWIFTLDFTQEILLQQFKTKSLKGFGINEMSNGVISAGVILHYLKETQHHRLEHISFISRIEESKYVWLDKFTIHNLELLSSPYEGASTLLDVLDNTTSAMGSRMLKRWMILPLKDKEAIDHRLNIVDYLLAHPDLSDQLGQSMKLIGDLERLISKVSIRKINPREIIRLKDSLISINEILQAGKGIKNKSLHTLISKLNALPDLINKVDTVLKPDPAVLINKGGVISSGVSDELDDLRSILHSGKDYLQQMQKREVENTGISSLKIGFNNVFGYYLEVTNAHKDKVPEEWKRKPTLTNSERYITDELKKYEEKILGAEEKILALELKIYQELVDFLLLFIQPVQGNATIIGQLDVLLSFALTAKLSAYCKPQINNSYVLEIKNGRHPVIETRMDPGESYIPNDVYLDNQKQQIIIITGPNMSGKSALLRQTAIIVLMAQMGSFVPAVSAKIGIIDKIFTRIGASDNLSLGESTFMVEMNETAAILNNLSNRSLILLDEIGRGTSTYDGVSIAWAITEFLHEHPLFKSKVLFATHYHELNEMASQFQRIKNFHVSIKEINKQVIFLRKLMPGGSEHSFGIHVAKMAGMPQTILRRADELLVVLEQSHSHQALNKQKGKPSPKTDNYQLSFIQLDDPLLEQIKDDILNIDINTLTPVEALMKLNEIKMLLGKK